jgi:hypothetical protein
MSYDPAQLEGVPALSRPMYADPSRIRVLDEHSLWLRQFWRICGAVTLDGRRYESDSDRRLRDTSLEWADENNAKIGLRFAPFQQWNSTRGEHVRDRGTQWRAAIADFDCAMRALLASRGDRQPDVALLACEAFLCDTKAACDDAACNLKIIAGGIRQAWPRIKILVYLHGSGIWGGARQGWYDPRYTPSAGVYGSFCDIVSCQVYRPSQLYEMYRTCASMSDEYDAWAPWLTFAYEERWDWLAGKPYIAPNCAPNIPPDDYAYLGWMFGQANAFSNPPVCYACWQGPGEPCFDPENFRAFVLGHAGQWRVDEQEQSDEA